MTTRKYSNIYNYIFAVESGNIDLIELTVGIGEMKMGETNQTRYEWALCKSAICSNIKTIEYLIDDKNIDPSKINCLFDVSDLDIFKYLVSKGADIHFENDLVLIQASYNNYKDIVKYIIENKQKTIPLDTLENCLSNSRNADTYNYLEKIINEFN